MTIRHNNREFPGGPVVRTPEFPLQEAWVRPPVRELRFHKLRGAAKKKKDMTINMIQC